MSVVIVLCVCRISEVVNFSIKFWNLVITVVASV